MSTFKAPLIDDQNFYAKRRAVIILNFVSFSLIGLVQFMFDLTVLLGFILMAIMVGSFVYLVQAQRAMNKMVAQHFLEADAQEIRILDQQKKLVEAIKVEDLDRIKVDHCFDIAAESLNDIMAELKGQPMKNSISIECQGKRRRLEFLIDSHYMLVQLQKVLKAWREQPAAKLAEG